MNRIINAIATVEHRIGALEPAAIAKLEQAASLTFDEHNAVQDAKSLAHASGVLAYEEAQTVYSILGNTPSHFSAQPLSHRLVVLKLAGELLLAGRK